MKTSLLVLAALFMICNQTVVADHVCDDNETSEKNRTTGPMQRALDSAKKDMDAAQDRKDFFDKELEGGAETIANALGRLVAAQAAERETQAKVEPLHNDYQQKATAVSNCVIGNDCTIEQKNQLALQLKTAGDVMLANDNANQSNINVRIQYQREYDTAQNTVNFDSSSTQADQARALLNLNEAAATYQKIKNELEQHVSSGDELQRNCKINQYNHDMHEIERREALLDKCKSDEGCNADDLASSGLLGLVYERPSGILPNGSLSQGVNDEILGLGPKRWHESGKIRFPDCGPQMSKECFKQHYESYWILDFISVFSYPISIPACTVINGYDYDLCMDFLPYVIVDSFARLIAPIYTDKQ